MDWKTPKYFLDITAKAKRDLKALPLTLRSKIDNKILSLQYDPRPSGVKKLKGKSNQYRVKVSNYRIIYEIHDQKLIILVIQIKHRKDAYK